MDPGARLSGQAGLQTVKLSSAMPASVFAAYNSDRRVLRDTSSLLFVTLLLGAVLTTGIVCLWSSDVHSLHHCFGDPAYAETCGWLQQPLPANVTLWRGPPQASRTPAPLSQHMQARMLMRALGLTLMATTLAGWLMLRCLLSDARSVALVGLASLVLGCVCTSVVCLDLFFFNKVVLLLGCGTLAAAAGAVLARNLLLKWDTHVSVSARWLQLAAQLVLQGPAVLAVRPLALLVWALLLLPAFLLPFCAAIVRGSYVPSPYVARLVQVDHASGTTCAAKHGMLTLCCKWQENAAAANGDLAWFQVPLLAGGLILASLLLVRVCTFIVSGTIAQRYLAPDTCATSMEGTGSRTLCGDTARCMLHALGPSLGSLAAFHRPDDTHTQYQGPLLNQLVVARLALLGEEYVSAVSHTSELLQRQGLTDQLPLWLVPRAILTGCTISAAVAVTGAVALAMPLRQLHWMNEHYLRPWHVCAMVAGTSAALLWCLCGTLLDAASTLLMMYMLEVDAGSATREDVHDVLRKLPLGPPAQAMSPGAGVRPAYSGGDRLDPQSSERPEVKAGKVVWAALAHV